MPPGAGSLNSLYSEPTYFLSLMRWMVDLNFCFVLDVSSRVGKQIFLGSMARFTPQINYLQFWTHRCNHGYCRSLFSSRDTWRTQIISQVSNIIPNHAWRLPWIVSSWDSDEGELSKLVLSRRHKVFRQLCTLPGLDTDGRQPKPHR